MHLTKLIVNKFGALYSGTYIFTDGLNIIRAHNGAGKSTMIEAILYAMFGASALRGSLDDVVTEGSPVSELKVEIEYGPYKVFRSKSSASVEGPGVKLSGQTNVSDFFYDLMGISKGSEASVMVSEQGDTAGIVSGKTSEITTLIETLAGFNQIDELLERVKVGFPSGNQALLEELLSSTEAELLDKESQPEEDKSQYSNTSLVKELQDADLRVMRLNEELSAAYINLSQAESSKTKLDDLVKRKVVIDSNISNKTESLRTLTLKSEEPVNNVSAEEAYLTSFPELQTRYSLYKSVTSFAQPETVWEGDLDSFNAELQSASESVTLLRDQRSKISASIDHHNSLINEDKICPICKQDISHLHEELNRTAKAKLLELTSEFTKINLALKGAENYLRSLKSIEEEQESREPFHGYADKSVVPWRILWNEEEVIAPSTAEFQRCRTVVQAARDQEKSIIQAKELIKIETDNLQILEKELLDITSTIESIVIVPTDELKLRVENLKKSKIEASDLVHTLNSRIVQNLRELARIESDNINRRAEIKSLKLKREELKERIKTDSRNAFIKKEVMKAKPVVLNRVWDSVLVAVSSAFSVLRGTESTVLKTFKGFSVNGLPVHRLSGSEKSILGIALRSTLRDVFAPASNLMIFDEPSADCDSDRTAAVAAALASLRGQVLMVTHEDISDSLANNIVEIPA